MSSTDFTPVAEPHHKDIAHGSFQLANTASKRSSHNCIYFPMPTTSPFTSSPISGLAIPYLSRSLHG